MAVIEYFLAGGVLLIVQGAYTLRRGDIRLMGFLMRPANRAGSGSRTSRIVGGIFFIASGLWVLHVPVFKNLRGVALAGWASGRWGPLLVVVLCAGLGSFLLAWPTVFLEWLRSSYPQVPAGERWALVLPRGVGVGALLIAIQVLAGILYYAGGR